MFGAICAGRLVQTNLEQIDQNRFVFELQDSGSINHITVFLLPDVPFPQGFGATVYFSWPGKPFQLLGGLSNAKPSAIFKLGGSRQSSHAPQVTAVLGISIESLQSVEAQISLIPKNNIASITSTAVVTLPSSTSQLSNRIITNLYNFLMSYAVDARQITPNEQFVPLKAFQEWHTKILKKLQMEPSFLDRDRE